MRHLDELSEHIPHLKDRAILDIGSGRGNFILGAVERGYSVVGIEPHPGYRAHIAQVAAEKHLSVSVSDGVGEQVPFPDAQFDTLNVNEVFEHVDDPRVLLKEMYRVLRADGYAYVSVPNRFGFFDPHYHLPFINWMPRAWADALLCVWGRAKEDGQAGKQRLTTMHYKTFAEAERMMREAGFVVYDIREEKIKKKIPAPFCFFALGLYRVLRFVYFDTAHVLLYKKRV